MEHDRCVVGDAQDGPSKLLGHQDRNSLLRDLSHDLVEIGYDKRSQTHRQFVEE
jgi:hypothetical protein